VRTIALPDTQGEVVFELDRLEELLLMLGGWEEEDHLDLPDPVGSRVALEAVQRVSSAVHAAERAGAAQPIAPDGRFELVPITWVEVSDDDLADLAALCQLFGRALIGAGDEIVGEALSEVAKQAKLTSEAMVSRFAQLHGLLDLDTHEDVAVLAHRLPAGADRVVLDDRELAAYHHIIGQVEGLWHLEDPLAKYLYRGLGE